MGKSEWGRGSRPASRLEPHPFTPLPWMFVPFCSCPQGCPWAYILQALSPGQPFSTSMPLVLTVPAPRDTLCSLSLTAFYVPIQAPVSFTLEILGLIPWTGRLQPHCSPSPSAGGCGSVWKHRKEALWASGKSPHLSGPVFPAYGVGLIPAGHRKDCGVIKLRLNE